MMQIWKFLNTPPDGLSKAPTEAVIPVKVLQNLLLSQPQAQDVADVATTESSPAWDLAAPCAPVPVTPVGVSWSHEPSRDGC